VVIDAKLLGLVVLPVSWEEAERECQKRQQFVKKLRSLSPEQLQISGIDGDVLE